MEEEGGGSARMKEEEAGTYLSLQELLKKGAIQSPLLVFSIFSS